MINLTKEDKKRAKHEPSFLKKVLEDQYEEIKTSLVSLPLERLPELRGQARAFRAVIDLLT